MCVCVVTSPNCVVPRMNVARGRGGHKCYETEDIAIETLPVLCARIPKDNVQFGTDNQKMAVRVGGGRGRKRKR